MYIITSITTFPIRLVTILVIKSVSTLITDVILYITYFSTGDSYIYTWYTLALNVFQEFDLDAEDFSNMDKCFHKIKVPFKKEFKKVVHNNYIQKTPDTLSKLTDNSKLYLHNKINMILLNHFWNSI